MRPIVRNILIAGLTILFLALFLWNSDPGRVSRLVLSTNVWWLLVGFGANGLALVLRTLRWQAILSVHQRPRFSPTFFANAVGYSLSTVLPVRAGDFARPALLSRRTPIKFSIALGTVLTERVLDLFAILTLFLIFYFTSRDRFLSDPATARRFLLVEGAAVTSVVILAVMSTFIVSIYFFRDHIRRLHEVLGRILPRGIRGSWMRFFDSFAASLPIGSNRSLFPSMVVLTAGIWLCIAGQFYLVLLAMRRPLPFTASFFITGMTILGLMIPTPGGVGGFHKACQIALTGFYRFDVDSSVAAALLVHVVGVVPVLLVGFVLVAREGMTWRQLTAIGEKPDQ